MRVIGVDFGSKRIGLAVGEAGVASPRPALAASGTLAKDAAVIADLARREGATRVVVGLPKLDDGSDGTLAGICRKLALAIEATGLTVDLVDESLTTAEAWSHLDAAGLKVAQVRARIDSAAACLLLERWFQEGKP